MSWLSVNTSETNVSPVKLTISQGLMKVFGGLKSEIDTLDNKNIVEIMDTVTAAPVDHQNIVNAIEKLSGASFADISKTWIAFKQSHDSENMRKIRALAKSLNDIPASGLPDSLEWKILNGDIDREGDLGSYGKVGLGASAAASIEFKANAKPPVIASEVSPPDLTDAALVRLGMKASVELDGELAFGLSVFDFESDASLSRATDIDIFFVEDPETRFGAAIAGNIKALIGDTVRPRSPFNIIDLKHLCDKEGLYALKFTADSKFGFNAKLGISQNTPVGNGEFLIGAKIEVGSKVVESGKFDYTICPDRIDGRQAIFVEIKRSNDSLDEETSSFSLEFDPTAYFKTFDKAVQGRLGEAKALLEEFEESLPGRSFFNDKISKLIDKELDALDEKDRGVLKVLVGIDKNKTPEEALRDRIIGSVDSSIDAWSEDVELAAEHVTQKVIAGMRKLLPVSESIEDKIHASAKKTLESKRDTLKKKIQDQIKNNSGYQSMVEKLTAAGASIEADITGPQKRLNAVTNAITGILNKLQARITKMSELMDTTTRKTLTLEMKSMLKQVQNESLHIQLALFPVRENMENAVTNPVNVETQALLDHVLKGELDAVIRTVAELDEDARHIKVLNGSKGYSVYEQLVAQKDTSLTLWDLNINSSDILNEELKMKVGIDGSITLDSSLVFDKINQSDKEKRQVRFFNSLGILNPGHNTIHAGLTVSREDEEFDSEEAIEYLQGMRKAGLLKPSTVNKVVDMLKKARSRGVRKARIDTGISFHRSNFDAMFNDVDMLDGVHRKPCEGDFQGRYEALSTCTEASSFGCGYYLETLSHIVASALRAHHTDQNYIDLVERFIDKGIYDIGMHAGLAEGIKYMTTQKVGRFVDEVDFASFLQFRHLGIMALFQTVSRMKHLSTATVDLQTMRADASVIRAQQQCIGNMISLWWQFDNNWKTWLFLTDEMRALHIALFLCLSRLAQGRSLTATAPLIWLTLTQKDENGADRTTVITDID